LPQTKTAVADVDRVTGEEIEIEGTLIVEQTAEGVYARRES